ncbi:MAG: macro domain-containing protein [Sandaracinus sp.]|nr:macro domain-containing protein [Sandaracinus sp.]MCB9633136.1 macro domain-containing protein [Sandaracinus sp.]
MPTSFVTGDLFAAPDLDALAHGCNCAGAMGKGIAIEFRARFPKMYAEYKNRCLAGTFALGDVFCWRSGAVTVFNLGTQKSWRTKAELGAIEQALRTMVDEAQTLGVRRIGLPRIGAGLGGLSWDAEVKPLLERIGDATTVELVVFETFVKSAPT